MSYRILLISSMYDGNIDAFYRKFRNVEEMSYTDHYALLRDKSTEFCASYTRGFCLLNHETSFISANDLTLQRKWLTEHNIRNSNDVLIRQVEEFQPEILWIDNLGLIDRRWIKEVRERSPSIKLLMGYHCSPYNYRILDNLKAMDATITCTPGMASEFRSNGIKTHLVYHAFDNTITGLEDESTWTDEDIVFSGSLITGSGFHNERIRFIKFLLENGIDISLFVNLESRKRILAKTVIYHLRELFDKVGAKKVINMFPFFVHGACRPESYSEKLLLNSRGPVYGQDMYSLFRKSKIVLNMHVGVAGQFAGNMRLFEVTGSGSCLLTDNKKNIRDLFEPDSEIITYNTVEECADKAKWLMEHDDIRKQVAVAGQKRTLKDHTVLKRCEQIVSILEDEIRLI